MIERLRLREFNFGDPVRPPVVVEVEYRPFMNRAYNERHGVMTRYEVAVDGKVVGIIGRVIESTDRNYNRIRVPGRGRKAWDWWSTDGKIRNAPGLYASTRRYAAAKLLGYDDAEVVK